MDAGRFGQITRSSVSISDHGYMFMEEIAPHEETFCCRSVTPARSSEPHSPVTRSTPAPTQSWSTGATTGERVRATVGRRRLHYNFHTIVAKECVFDRIRISHDISLFDMDAKYADVVSVDTSIEYLATLKTTRT